jgi:hypothetical protein
MATLQQLIDALVDKVANENRNRAQDINEIYAILRLLNTGYQNMQTSRDFWAATENTITITGSSTTVTPSNTLVIPAGAHGIPADTTLDAVHLLLKWRQVEDTSGSDNAINNAAMAVQIDDSGDTGWLTGYTFTNGDLNVDISVSTVHGGDMRESLVDIKSLVDAADTYDIQIINAQATGANLILRDFQWGVRIWWH